LSQFLTALVIASIAPSSALPAQALVQPDAAAIFSIRSAFVMLLPPYKDIFDEDNSMKKK
jgi:hypothetical protein